MILLGEVSDTVQIATMVCALIASIVASIGVPLMVAWIARMSKKAEDTKAALEAVDKKVDHVATLANGLTEKMLMAERKAAKGEGKDEERTEQKEREAERAKGAADARGGVSVAVVNGDHTTPAPVAIQEVHPAVVEKLAAGTAKKLADPTA